MSIYQPTTTNPDELKIAEYDRRSSDEKAGKQLISIQSQKSNLEEQFPNHKLKRLYHIEESKSAFYPHIRPKFDELMSLIESGNVNCLIAWHPNRLSRNSVDAGLIVHLLRIGKLKSILFGNYTFENTNEGRLHLQQALSQGEYESDKLSTEVRAKNRTYLEQGKWLGPATEGYLNYTDPISKAKSVIPDPERYQLLESAIRLILGGSTTPMEALNVLNNEWAYRRRKTAKTGGGPLSRSAFYKILSCRFYCGWMDRKEGSFKGAHKAMFTEEEFDLLQIRLGKKKGSHRSSHNFPYKNILKCGECGGSITCEEKWQIICSVCKTKFHKGANTTSCPQCSKAIEEMMSPKILKYIYYHCTKKINKNCSQGSISQRALEDKISEELGRFEIPQLLLDWANEYMGELNEFETEHRTHVSANYKGALEDCEKKLDNLLKLKISPQNSDGALLSDNEFAEQRRRLVKEKGSLLEQMQQASERQDSWHDTVLNVFNFARNASYWLKHGDVYRKTEIAATIGSNLIIKDKNLLLEGLPEFYLVEKGKNQVKEILGTLEPENLAATAANNTRLTAARLTWLTIVDEVRTKIATSPSILTVPVLSGF